VKSLPFTIVNYATVNVLSRVKNSGRQCDFKIWIVSQMKKKSLPDYAHVNKVSENL
jgi:hypothetical protein